MIYAAVWILLPRVYLGIHYPSDILAGRIIGVATVGMSMALLSRDTPFANWLIQPVVLAEARYPRVFYAAAFAISFEMTMMFDDVRDFIRALVHGARMAGYASMGEETILLALIVLLLVCGVAVWAARRAIHRQHACQRARQHLIGRPPFIDIVTPRRGDVARH